MKAFWALFKVSLQSMLVSSFRFGGSKKRKATSAYVALAAVGALFLFVSATYSFSLAFVLAPYGGLDLMLLAMAVLGVLLAFAVTVYYAQGLLFSTKDIDLVFSLPVSAFAVMLARVAALYFEVLLLVELFMLPAGVAYLVFGGTGGVAVLVLALLSGVFLAFVPALAGLVLGCVVSLLVSRLKHKNIVAVVLNLMLFVVVMVFSFVGPSAASAVEQLVSVAALRQGILAASPLFAWFVQGVAGLQAGPLLGLWAVCALPFFGVCWVFSLFYKSLLTHLSSHTLKANYKLRRLAVTGSFGALLKKEAVRLFGTPMYLLNTAMGTLLCLLLTVAALASGPFARQLPAQLAGGAPAPALMALMLLGVMGFMLATIIPACASISLEGKSLWILKSAPLATRRIFAAKAGLNVLLCAATALVCVPLLAVALALPVAQTLVVLAMCLLFSVFVGCSGLLLNLRFPRLSYDNEVVVIKQSLSVLLGLLTNMAAIVLIGGLYGLLMAGLGLSFSPSSLAVAAVLALADVGCLALLNTRGVQLFAAL